MADHERLAEQVRLRAAYLGLSQQQVSERSRVLDTTGRGLSVRTVSQIMTAKPADRYERTLGLLDRVLEWPPGTSKALLEGDELPELPAMSEGERVAALERRVERLSSKLDAVLAFVRARRELDALDVEVVDDEV